MARRFRLSAAFALAAIASGCGNPEIRVPDIMTIVAILPGHGVTEVSLDVEPLVYFSHPAASADEIERDVRLECLGAPTAGSCAAPNVTGCDVAEPDATKEYQPASLLVRVRPTPPGLQSDTCYVLIVAEGAAAEDELVDPLPTEVRSSFQTR